MTDLDPIEVRILGALAEKEATTPDYYPLSLNALVNACNQRSNRAPVMALTEDDVARSLERLLHLGWVTRSASGGRVAKYGHNLGGKLQLEPEELAVLTELLLRGPQTVGELRARAERMQPLPDLAAVEAVLDELMTRESALVVKLPRQPGRKEHRYMHLLAGEPEVAAEEAEAPPEAATLRVRAENERVAALEQEVCDLRGELEALRREVTEFKSQFE